jgi:ketosteroid isomerase-like protein
MVVWLALSEPFVVWIGTGDDRTQYGRKLMETAPEIRQLLLDYYAASASGDVAFLEQFISSDPQALVIGTDPGEWWAGGAQIVATWSAAWRSRGGFPVVGADPQCYRAGPVAWAADQAAFKLPDGRQLPFRLTVVLHQEHARWRLVQAHFSFGVPDTRAAELVGRNG